MNANADPDPDPDLDALPAATREAAVDLLLALADDEFVAGHRLTDWVAVGPTMEVDNSIASIAQDELGHARLWYELVIEARGGTLDDLALNRPPGERHNTVLVEGVHDDFADAIAVTYLYDRFEQGVLESLAQGDFEAVAARAEKALNEEPYHREHADRWLDRLVATEEGRRRLTRAFETNLPLAADLFAFDVDATVLADAGVLAIPLASIRADWQATVGTRLADLPLDLDETALDAVDDPPEERAVWEALRTVEDPELPVSVVDLTLTYSGCPARDLIVADAEAAVPGDSGRPDPNYHE